MSLMFFLLQLYESEKSANEKLRRDVDRLQQELKETKLELERAKLKNESKTQESKADERVRNDEVNTSF